MTREEAVKLLKEYALRVKPFYEPQRTEYTQAINMAIEALQAEPRSASRWIDADLDPDFAKCKKCSENKVDIAYSKDFIKQERWNFCPYCGSDMRGD